MHRYLILGTDTGVGKTFVSAALCAALLRTGQRVTACKPIETGNPRESDLDVIARLCGPSEKLDVHPGVRYALAAAPSAAARAQGSPAPSAAQCAMMAHAGSGAIVVETCGGALTPLSASEYVADIAAALPDFRTLLVAGLRLGVLSHTFGALEYLRSHGRAIASVLLNDCFAPSPPWYVKATREDLAARGLACAYVAHGAQITDPVFDELIAS